MRTTNIAMIAAACGFDAVYIDLEHNPTSLETAAAICVAALGIGITPIARVSSRDLMTPRGSLIAARKW
jgi:4-hydroxy-2-oxoheptanedioate aldolase